MELACNSGGRFILYLTPLRLVRGASLSSTWRRPEGNPSEVHEMTHAQDLRLATAWYQNSDNTITVVE